VTRGDFPDPFVCPTASGFIAYGTNSAGVNVQVRTSPDLWTWSPVQEALPSVARWATTGWTWSPAAVVSGGGAVLWYVVREPRSGRQVISVAHGAEPVGPFHDRSEGPAIAQLELGGSIDPSPFVDVDGTAYLLWKADANALGRRSNLWGQRLNDERDALVDGAVPLLDHDRRWERPLIEAPSMTTVGGRYWLFYSGGWWESAGYGIGIAVADHPLGPWRKLTRRRPWVTSQEMGAGPGGQEVFRDGTGVTYLAYHAWDPARVGYGAGGERSLRIGVLEFGGDELPELRPLAAARD
jgi:beta-xylosidase